MKLLFPRARRVSCDIDIKSNNNLMKSKGTSYTQKQKNILATLGENIKLARLRRKLSIRSMAERAGIATSTLGNIEAGSSSVSLGSYLQILSVLRLEDDLLLIADKDPLGRQIQDAGLIVKKRAPKMKKTESAIEHVIDKGNSVKPKFD
jgi:transcriptional regulator with XRE-family HTH domain